MMLRIADDLSKLHFELLARGASCVTPSLARRAIAAARKRAWNLHSLYRIGEKRTFLIDAAQTLLRLAEEQEASIARGAAKDSQAPIQQQQQVQPKRDKDD